MKHHTITRPVRAGLAGLALAGLAATAVATVDAPASAASSHARSSSSEPTERQQFGYAVLQAPGWSVADGEYTADGETDYVNGDDTVRLEWHPRSERRKPYTIGGRDGATTMDGDRAPVFVYQGIPTAVGPTVNQHFLTLSSTTLTPGELGDLAGQVSRTAYATLEARGWLATSRNVPSDDKLAYTGPGESSLSLNWRPADDRSDSTSGTRVGTTRIDGDRAGVFEDPAGSGYFTVVGPRRQGKVLTLSTATVPLKGVESLATHVHRR